MRKVDYLIEDTRNSTENSDVSDTIGIEDSEFLRFLNDAQYRIHSLITQKHPSVFIEEYEQACTKDVDSYALPFYVHMKNKISNIEYSPTSLDDDYYLLQSASLKQRYPGATGDPYRYIRKSGKLLLSPVPSDSNGTLRVNYVGSVPRLDKKRGSVSSVTLDSSTRTITSLTLNVSTDTVDSTELDKHSRITIVDSEGNIKMRNIHVDSINASTGVVTVNSSFVYETGETISSGDVVVAGRNSTTHSILDDSVERYLIAYASMEIFHRDSNADLQQQIAKLTAMEEEIIDGYADITDDVTEIPEIISEDDSWAW